jgi:surface polysaccharide O-acyltransferase-like enzyme
MSKLFIFLLLAIFLIFEIIKTQEQENKLGKYIAASTMTILALFFAFFINVN